ncbi:TolB family protein [Synechocystis sp. PCC 7509]|uniref:TolB family protein n=1 Tax=Synechocystis sp. PCC 7509 TaxID=927677 RepID=UPI0002ACBDA6|nr:TolB family protein [Synechocystis sp. PCC 7509]
MMRFVLPLIIVLVSLLSGCTGYYGLLNYPFEPGGKSLNSPSSDLTAQIAGRYITFTSDRAGRQNIYLFDTVSQTLIDLPLLNQLDAISAHPDISSDGRYIVFSASRQGRTGIFIYDRQLRQSRNLTPNLQAQVQNPTISADGNTIAFESNVNGQWDILVYNRSGERLNIPAEPR